MTCHVGGFFNACRKPTHVIRTFYEDKKITHIEICVEHFYKNSKSIALNNA